MFFLTVKSTSWLHTGGHLNIYIKNMISTNNLKNPVNLFCNTS